MGEIWDAVQRMLGVGVEPKDLEMWQMAIRAAVVYIAALLIVRLGDKRFLGKITAFDVILGIILGSVLSRAINGSAPFWETIVAGIVLVALHWLFAAIAFRSDRFGNMVKGHTRQLVRDGEVQWDEMREASISKDDLLGAVRQGAQLPDLNEVEDAYLERSGDISVIPIPEEPRIVEVRVEDGVQTVRIQLDGAGSHPDSEGSEQEGLPAR